ncbi:MAG TPA: hypothetical protein VKK06_05095, partial [Terriglobia bacterium]|nr:hypothetical protein [Terriglobia bacterium]
PIRNKRQAIRKNDIPGGVVVHIRNCYRYTQTLAPAEWARYIRLLTHGHHQEFNPKLNYRANTATQAFGFHSDRYPYYCLRVPIYIKFHSTLLLKSDSSYGPARQRKLSAG